MQKLEKSGVNFFIGAQNGTFMSENLFKFKLLQTFEFKRKSFKNRFYYR